MNDTKDGKVLGNESDYNDSNKNVDYKDGDRSSEEDVIKRRKTLLTYDPNCDNLS